MKILLDIGHPAHVHLFRNMICRLQSHHHEILITARDKDVSLFLLKHYNIPFLKRPSSKSNIISKFFGIFIITAKLWKISTTFHPDMVIGGVGNVYISLLGSLIRKPSLIFDDTEHSKYELFFVKYFSNVIITPDCYLKHLGEKQIRYSGYHELAYLHPNQFNPDFTIKKELGIADHEKYSILRFVSWQASHDIGHRGISDNNKIKAVTEFSKYSKVFITSEGPLPKKIEKFRIKISPEKMHDTLSFASLFYGESATMASECAILGVPSVYIDNIGRGYTFEEEKKYSLVYNYNESSEEQDNSILKGVELLKNANLKAICEEKRKKLIEDNIDVTAFMTWFVETYPLSFKLMKHTPNIQLNFK